MRKFKPLMIKNVNKSFFNDIRVPILKTKSKFSTISNITPKPPAHSEFILDVDEDPLTMRALFKSQPGKEWIKRNGEDSSINIKFTHHKGRGIFTSSHLIKDEIIFAETPFASHPKGDEYCFHCQRTLSQLAYRLPSGSFIELESNEVKIPPQLAKHPKVIQASKTIVKSELSKNVSFCSHECKLEAEQNYSELLIATQSSFGLSSLRDLEKHCEESETSIPLLAVRIYARLISEYEKNEIIVGIEKGKQKISGGSWEFLLRLNGASHDLESMPSFQEELTLISNIFSGHKLVNKDTYKMIAAACYRNSSDLNVQTEYLQQADNPKQIKTRTGFPTHGTFLPFFGAFINHSCDPNIKANSTTNHLIEWVSDRDILPGEELTVSYIDSDLPLDDRRELLWNNWGFWCSCNKCVEQETNLSSTSTTDE